MVVKKIKCYNMSRTQCLAHSTNTKKAHSHYFVIIYKPVQIISTSSQERIFILLVLYLNHLSTF